MICVFSAGTAPAVPYFVPGRLKHLFIRRVFPQHQIFDDLEQAFPLLFLRLFGREKLRPRRGIVHHLREDHCPRSRQRTPRPP